jgi:hypothetical protein
MRNVVLREVREHVFERFSKWNRNPADKKSARAVSEMLITLEFLTGKSVSSDSRLLLRQLDGGLQLGVGARVKLHSLRRAPELNGLHGEIVSPLDGSTGRWGIKTDTDGRVRTMRPDNLRRIDARNNNRFIELQRSQRGTHPQSPLYSSIM